jgi:hypothetical protein
MLVSSGPVITVLVLEPFASFVRSACEEAAVVALALPVAAAVVVGTAGGSVGLLSLAAAQAPQAIARLRPRGRCSPAMEGFGMQAYRCETWTSRRSLLLGVWLCQALFYGRLPSIWTVQP